MVSSEVDEKLYDLIMQCQGDRIEEQRSALGGIRSGEGGSIEEDIKAIVMKMQAGRIEGQRADLKSPATNPKNEKNS